MKILFYLIEIILFINFTEQARILCVFPVPYHSHQVVLRVIAEALVDRGHEVVLITPEPRENKKDNLTEIDLSKVSYNNIIWNKEFKNHIGFLKKFGLFSNLIISMKDKSYSIFEAQLASDEIKRLLSYEKDHFDLIIAQDCVRPAMLFGAKFKVPIVLASAFPVFHQSFHHVGSEVNPFLYPLFTKVPHNFNDRILTFFESWKIYRLLDYDSMDNELLEKYFGEKVLSVKELAKNVKMVVLTPSRMWDNNRAVTSAVTHMGAIHIKEPRPLPEELGRYLDSSKNGVIYMSLGSKFRSSDLPSHTLKAILEVFASVPYEVVWKWDADSMANKPDNLRLEKWLPQYDLLCHPTLKLFITHGGLQSVSEGIAAGVPMLAFPLVSDQHRNAQILKQHSAALSLNMDNLTAQDLKKSILEIIRNNTYRANTRRLHSLLQDEQLSGLELALSRIELLLDRGWSPTGPAADVTFAEYFMLDVFLPLALALMIFILLLVIALKRFAKDVVLWCAGTRCELSTLQVKSK